MMTTDTNKVYRKDLFELPENTVYLDGNSLGPLVKSVPGHVQTMLTQEWGASLIRGWNDCDWMDQPRRVGNQVARLIGAPTETVMMGDTLSIKVYQALAAALSLNDQRKIVLSDRGNFPTDLYMADGLIKSLKQEHSLKLVDPEQIEESLDESVAVLLLTHVDYRTGRLHDMASLTRQAQALGIIVIWDLAHSAGALTVDLQGCNCEFAVGCTYKYLNGGPGAPAFVYVRKDLIESTTPALSGWLGHDAPFAFDLDYRPAGTIERMRVGTPPVIQLSALEEALSVWEDIAMSDIRKASIALSEQFIHEVEKRCPQLLLASPRDPEHRGSQVSFSFENGYAAMQALIDNKVIGDFRAPNVMRFGFTPLYLDSNDINLAVERLVDIMENKKWDQPKYRQARRVT